MTVIEYGPGAGWYSKILAPVLQDKGQLYWVGNEGHLKWLRDTIKHDSITKVKDVLIDINWNGEKASYELGKVDFGVKKADMVLSIREYHNFATEQKAKLNKAAFKALKSGGRYVIIDHTRRHMQPESHELRRREDPVQVILEVQAEGFVLEKYSDMFLKLDDELRYEVGRKTVTGNTDRFTLVFKKP
jgi:predicted methyltransferase